MPEARRTIIINTPPEVLYSVITDYEQYPQFLKEVERIDILNTTETPNGRVVRARYTVRVVKSIQYVIDLTEDKYNSVRWKLVESSIMRSNVGGWTLKDLGDGRTEATYGLEAVPKGLFVPKKIISMLTDTTLPSTLQSFKKRAESLV